MIGPFAAAVAWMAASWALGRGLARSPASAGERLLASVTAGLVTLALLLYALHYAGLGWRPSFVFAAVAAVAAWSGWRARGRPPATSWTAPGWGDGIAAIAFLAYLVPTVLTWNLAPDFIYHWGFKGQKLYLARDLDFAFLAAPENVLTHPDYPTLLPSLYAVTAIFGGGFEEAAMALWSVFFYALAVLAGRELLARLEVSETARQAGVAILALVMTMFGVGYLQAGGADWLIVVAALAGTLQLVGRPLGRRDAPLGFAAALAAASKIEGLALAAFLVAAHLWRRAPELRRAGTRRRLAALARVTWPVVAVAGAWAWGVWRHRLFQPDNAGVFDLERAAIALPELGRSLLVVNWHGWSLALLGLPLLLAVRRLRVPATVLAAQLLFYVFVYSSAPVDTRLYVATSAPRLFFHLLPATLLLLLAAADRWSLGKTGPADRSRVY